MDHITELFCTFDDFCEENTKYSSKKRRCALSLSEAMTIIVMFQKSGFRFFKYFYCQMLVPFWKSHFPKLLSYNRFVEIMPRCLESLTDFFNHIKGLDTGISIIDSTKIQVCHNLRIKRNRVFKGVASQGMSSTGWFYGFKLHIIINSLGQITSLDITSGRVHDVTVLESLTKDLKGVLLGDRGYLSEDKAEALAQRGLKVITPFRKNMKNKKLHTTEEKRLLSKRNLIETINNQLKNLYQMEHSRHRSTANFFVNIMAAVVAYSLNPNKPTLKI